MDQKRGQNVTPVNAAATDPAALPGLIVPAPREAKDAEEPETAAAEAPEAPDEPEETEAESSEDDEAAGEAGDGEAAEDKAGDEAGESDAEPEFEASDRRGSVVADESGVRFTLDDTEAEFDWDEIGAVEYATSRWGRRLTVTVHLRGRRLYETDLTAPDKATLEQWTTGLDKLMDAHFED
ncbi:hypothetical protein [Streptomyces smaragdinus]|uniref:hypothetical protein n=1 Tax=Streptomyces smaragdinus TaxID=2585196 RepID=UPI002B1EFFD3|nr:hypothetical protein [Streptomyces smaragdinus]